MSTGQRAGRGRQAEAARNDLLVLEAAREVLTANGFDAPVAAIAARAGVGIASLYRRYPTKEALLQRMCILAMEQTIEAAEAGIRAADPWQGLTGYIERCVAFQSGALAPLAGTIEVTPEMSQTMRRSVRLAERLVERAHQAGRLRADVTTLDISLLLELFSRRAPNMSAADSHNARGRLLAIALDGLRASSGADPLPGRPPSRARYEERWRRR